MALAEQASPFGTKSHFVGYAQTLRGFRIHPDKQNRGHNSLLVRLILWCKKTAPPFQITQREGLLSCFPDCFETGWLVDCKSQSGCLYCYYSYLVLKFEYVVTNTIQPRRDFIIWTVGIITRKLEGSWMRMDIFPLGKGYLETICLRIVVIVP